MAKKGYILMENGEKIELEFFPNEAPNTVSNFEKLANEGFYDGVIFHRVIPGFVSQPDWHRDGRTWLYNQMRNGRKSA
jgi:peptidyl-prolyl cis-trans isomerase B (cyclophilin B)